jgi:cytochrome c peroxidase
MWLVRLLRYHLLIVLLLLGPGRLLSVVAQRTSMSGISVELAVRHTFHGEPLQLDSLRYKNGAGETLSVVRLSYLLSGFALQRNDGTWEELPGSFAWMDSRQNRTVVRLESVREGKYLAMRYSFGVDAPVNHGDPAKYPPSHPLNPNLNGLHWDWQGGYIFLAFEGLYRGATNDQFIGYSYHFARDTNYTRVTLPLQLDLRADARVQVDFDLATLLDKPKGLSFEKNGSSTHSRQGDPIAIALQANLPGAWRVRDVGPVVPSKQKAALAKALLPAKWTVYPFKMSSAFPVPDLPLDNPLIEERVSLGKLLFHDASLSRDGSLSCASCHKDSSAFSDARRFSLGVGDQVGTRQAMPLFNMAWKSSFFWDGRAPSLRAQALMPIQDHAEMDESLSNVVMKLKASKEYGVLFQNAFDSGEITADRISLALEQFVLTLTSYESRFDRSIRGEEVLSTNELRGFELFMTESDPRTGFFGADCFHCHGGPLFSDHQFHNNGLDATHDRDPGRFKTTGLESDRGKFSTPSLRNIALTAPYMHDGRFATLEQVIEHYSTGVKRSPTLDPNLAKHAVGGLQLSAEDKAALVAFLKTLTDEKYLSNAPKR